MLVLSPASAWATTFTVTNTSASGTGSLRQATLDANGHAGLDTIADPLAVTPIQRTHELVFVDPRVPDRDSLLTDLTVQAHQDRYFEIITLDATRDGVEQVSEALKSRVQLDAIHFLTHGTAAAVQLGGSWLNALTLAANTEAVAGWGQALKADADLLFYGCDLAASTRGRALMEWVAALTQADVAASIDKTGHVSQGGDWDLEYTAGDIESRVAFGGELHQSWGHVLSDGAVIGVMTFTGVDQTTPLGAFASDSGFSASASTTVSSAPGELVFGVVGVDDGTDYDLTTGAGAGQTVHWDLAISEGNGAGSTEAGAASVVTSWSWTAVADDWAIAGVSIRPSGAIAVDGTPSTGTTTGSSITFSHPTSGSNRLMLVGVSVAQAGVETVNSITYNGVNLTRVGFQNSPNDEMRVEIWALVAPDTGTHDVVVNFTGSGHWTFDEGIGQTAADSSPNGNDGTLGSTPGVDPNDPAWLCVAGGFALDFDGSDYVEVPDTPDLDFGATRDFSISAWFYRDGTATEIVLAKRNGTGAGNVGYSVGVSGDRIVLEVADGTNEYRVLSTTTFTTPGWHHVAVVWDDSAEANTLVYIDGVDDTGTRFGPHGAIGSLANSLAFHIGAMSGGFNFDGRLDDVRVYDSVLSAAEVAALAASPPTACNSLTLADHGGGQVSDRFTTISPVTDTLFQFELTRAGTVTVDNVRVNFTTAGGVANADVSGGELWEDTNGNGAIDVGDTLIEGALAPVGGVLTFTTDFTPATTGTIYFVRATVANLVPGDTTTFSLGTADIDELEVVTESGSITDATHTQDVGLQTNYRAIGTAADYTAGTVTASNGSPVVDGAGTAWQTANRGRGDRIRIDGVDYTILSVDTQTQLTLTTPFTGIGGAGKAYTIARQFTTLQAWEDCVSFAVACPFFPVASASLVADDRNEIGIAYDDSVFTAGVVINGSITDLTHDITLTADDGNRHYGVAGNGVVVDMGALATAAIRVQDDFVTVEWLELKGGSGSTAHGLRVESIVAPSKLVVRNALIHNMPGQGIRLDDADIDADIYNNIIYEVAVGIRPTLTLAQARILNNTIYRCNDAGFGEETGINGSGTNVTLRNNIAHSNVGGDYKIAGIDAASSNNLASDTTGITHSPAGGGQDSVPLASMNFVSTTAGSEDLHITAGSAAIDAGADLSGIFTDDIDAQTRTPLWDIGADEFGAGGATLTLADHAAGQVSDRFTATSPLTDTLFQFELTRAGTVTVD
ncbi:MAG: DUF4347 domain-containing protein, partial [Paracoccaceae bacterium]